MGQTDKGVLGRRGLGRWWLQVRASSTLERSFTHFLKRLDGTHGGETKRRKCSSGLWMSYLEIPFLVVQRMVLLSFTVCGKDEKRSELFFFELLLF